jgi:hypothetical protein
MAWLSDCPGRAEYVGTAGWRIFRLAIQSHGALIAALDSEQRMNHDYAQHDSHPRQVWRLRYSIMLSGIGAIGLYLLLRGHWAHVVGALPYLLLLACPLMHIFMHRGHHGHRSDQARKHDDLSGPA